jgi:hypothetical protein
MVGKKPRRFNTAEFSSLNQIGGRADSAWDDGSAFPDISSLEWAVGDRIITPGNQRGVVASVSKKIGITSVRSLIFEGKRN